MQCIVQSYLRWLEDSDYNALCALCTESLSNGEVIRLVCYGEYNLRIWLWQSLSLHLRTYPN